MHHIPVVMIMCMFLADEVRRVMMETVIPTVSSGVKMLKSRTTKEDSQVVLFIHN